MAQKQRLILGLGNPGSKYEGTRHNVGFEVVDRVAERCGVMLQPHSHTNSVAGKGRWHGYSFVMAKPLTWMNLSGQTARSYQRRMSLDSQEILVVLDDIHLPFGVVRIRKSGGSGGHNGMQNIIDALGSDQIPRLRIGISGDFEHGSQSDYVLSRFDDLEIKLLDQILDHSRDAVLEYINKGVEGAMNQYNRQLQFGQETSETVHRDPTESLLSPSMHDSCP